MELNFSAMQTEAVLAVTDMYKKLCAGTKGGIECGITVLLIGAVLFATVFIIKIRRQRREARRSLVYKRI